MNTYVPLLLSSLLIGSSFANVMQEEYQSAIAKAILAVAYAVFFTGYSIQEAK